MDGTIQEFSAPYTPKQNGLAERMNQTLSTLANAMLEDSKLPKSFWTDVMSTATYVTACSPSSALSRGVSYQVLFNRKADPTLFQPFRCLAYALTPKEYCGGKFKSHGQRCIMLGYTYGQQAYKLLDLEQQTIISSRHVTFDESGTISDAESTPWKATTQEQLEGLLLRCSHQPEHIGNEDDLESETPNTSNTPNVSNAPDASDASKPVGAPTNCSVEDLANHLDKLCLEAPRPTPPISTTSPASPSVQLLRPVLLWRYVTLRKSGVEGGWDLASPYVVHPCLHAQWSHISGLVGGGDKDLSRGVNKPVGVGPSRLSE